LIFEHVTLLMF